MGFITLSIPLQGAARDLVVHGMQGFDYEKAKCLCKLHDDYAVESIIAIGKPGKQETSLKVSREKRFSFLAGPLKNLLIDLNKKS